MPVSALLFVQAPAFGVEGKGRGNRRRSIGDSVVKPLSVDKEIFKSCELQASQNFIGPQSSFSLT
jgi:hypothetical protein